jgi:hypothetical protein
MVSASVRGWVRTPPAIVLGFLDLGACVDGVFIEDVFIHGCLLVLVLVLSLRRRSTPIADALSESIVYDTGLIGGASHTIAWIKIATSFKAGFSFITLYIDARIRLTHAIEADVPVWTRVPGTLGGLAQTVDALLAKGATDPCAREDAGSVTAEAV